MTKREIGFLLIGLGLGLLFATVAVIQVLASLSQRAYIISYSWDKVILLAPTVLLITGVVLLARRQKNVRASN